MGPKNSSATRVQPVFNLLLDRHWSDPAFAPTWLGTLWGLADGCSGAVPVPADCGRLAEADAPRDRARRPGRVFERREPPPGALLEWMLRHPDALTGKARTDPDYGGSGVSTDWRRRLFDGTPTERQEAQAEALAQLARAGAGGSRHRWWAFEGFTALDCCLVTDTAVIVVEGKRTERVSGNVLWYPERNQLWRNVEAAKTVAKGRAFGVIVGVEEDEDGQREVALAMNSLDASCPHLTGVERVDLAGHLLGYVTWTGAMKRAFDLPDRCCSLTMTTTSLRPGRALAVRLPGREGRGVLDRPHVADLLAGSPGEWVPPAGVGLRLDGRRHRLRRAAGSAIAAPGMALSEWCPRGGT